MQAVKSIFYICVLCFLLIGCSKGTSIVPKSIQGRRISFYTAVSSESDSQVFLGKSVVYVFENNRKYRAHSEGKVVDEGDYSYVPIRGSNSARLILTYTQDVSKIYEYAQRMDFNSPNSGKWSVTKTTDPGVTKREMGTFRILD